MKTFSKMLSVIIAVIMIIGAASVGMSAYAVSDDVIGNYDYKITSPYDNVDWSAVNAYKAATHVHTVRSDADTELNDMIREYYRLGYDGLALTDHGTVNYSWMDGGHRLAWFDYQYFVHGNVDELSQEEYTAITTGTAIPQGGSEPRGYGMTEIPLGIELNGASTNKCHINSYYADCGHGDLEMDTSWPESAVVKSYNAALLTSTMSVSGQRVTIRLSSITTLGLRGSPLFMRNTAPTERAGPRVSAAL